MGKRMWSYGQNNALESLWANKCDLMGKFSLWANKCILMGKKMPSFLLIEGRIEKKELKPTHLFA